MQWYENDLSWFSPSPPSLSPVNNNNNKLTLTMSRYKRNNVITGQQCNNFSWYFPSPPLPSPVQPTQRLQSPMKGFLHHLTFSFLLLFVFLVLFCSFYLVSCIFQLFSLPTQRMQSGALGKGKAPNKCSQMSASYQNRKSKIKIGKEKEKHQTNALKCLQFIKIERKGKEN